MQIYNSNTKGGCYFNTLKEVTVQYVKSRLSMPQVSKKIPRGLKTEKADEGT